MGRLRVGWVVLFLVGCGLAVRLTHWSSSEALIAITALTPIWMLAVWPVAAWSVLRRRWLLAFCSIVLIGVNLVLIVPEVHPWSTAKAPHGSWRLTVFDANVRYNNTNLAGIAGQIAADRPQLVTLEELSFENSASLERTGALHGYPWHIVRLAGGANGFGVWSRVPMTDAQLWNVLAHPEVEATLRPAGQPPIRLLVVHTLAPRGPGQPALWRTEMSQISAKVRTEERPLIVAGDFNATADMSQFRSITSHGLDDAAVKSGEGWRMTWPANIALIPDLIRIDHVLYSSALTVTAYRLGSASGSDHRPLVVTLAEAS